MASSANKAPVGLCDAAIIACAFNATRDHLAYSPNNNTIVIVNCAGDDCTKWKTVQTLSEHDQTVSALDWSPVTGQLLSCSHDRTAYVWTQAEDAKQPSDAWTPVLILLDSQMKHGFTCAKWSGSGQKLYVGGASPTVAVGKYDAESDWWRCTVATPHCSSVTCLAPHPVNDTLLATGSTDCTVKVISTFNKSIDGAANRLAKLGTEMATFNAGAWVNAISWSESGTSIAIAAHDSRVVVYCGDNPVAFESWASLEVRLSMLPLRSVEMFSETAIVAAGHDFYPVLLERKGDAWKVTKTGAKHNKKAEEKLSETQIARLKFQNQASIGQATSIDLPTTRHSNTITMVHRAGKDAFASFGLDGRVEMWKLAELVGV